MLNLQFSKIRKVLDAPFSQKGVFFYILFPILILISFVVAFVAKIRRMKSYRKKNQLNQHIKIICVGNISIGGSGKSPVVQALATEYLEKGFVVGIASRGITDFKHSIYIDSHHISDNLIHLSDENREHYEILKIKFPKSHFFILQNKDRLQALNFFSQKVTTENGILILDDGLQHFQCPRDVNLCVWQPDLLMQSPSYSMPIGPYREGFGSLSLKSLLQEFDFRIWSRVKEKDTEIFLDKIKNSLKKYGLCLNERDMIAEYKLNQLQIGKADKPISFYNDLEPSILTGIAYPENFISDLKDNFPFINKYKSLFLQDHSGLNSSAKKFLEANDFFIFTAKDFFRWISDPDFVSLIDKKIFYVFYVEIHFLKRDKIDF